MLRTYIENYKMKIKTVLIILIIILVGYILVTEVNKLSTKKELEKNETMQNAFNNGAMYGQIYWSQYVISQVDNNLVLPYITIDQNNQTTTQQLDLIKLCNEIK